MKALSLSLWEHGATEVCSLIVPRSKPDDSGSFFFLSFFLPIFHHFSVTFHAHFWSQNVPKVLPNSTLIFHICLMPFLAHFGDIWASLGTQNDKNSLSFPKKLDTALFLFFDRHGPNTTPQWYQQGPNKHSNTFPKCNQQKHNKRNVFWSYLGPLLAPKMIQQLMEITPCAPIGSPWAPVGSPRVPRVAFGSPVGPLWVALDPFYDYFWSS